MKALTQLKRQAVTAWLKIIPAQVLQQTVIDLNRAFENFFAKRSRYPRFKSRQSRPSFRYPQAVKVEGNRIYLPKVGWVKFFKSREIEGKIKNATIYHRTSGWYVSIHAEVELQCVPSSTPTVANTVGIDLGLNDFAVLSNGRRISNPRYYQRAQKKLATAQRVLARRQHGSRRWQRQKEKVARLYEKVANDRQDFLHKLSHQLITENEVIVAEDLDVAALARSRIAKSVQDAGWGELLRQLKYKSVWSCKTFHQIDRWFPSTRLHADCGTMNTVGLSERIFRCQGCGELVDRDLNAAANIKHQGLKELLTVGHTVSGDST
jgi:putative transposase